MKINWFKYAAPTHFYPLAGRLVPRIPVEGRMALDPLDLSLEEA